MYLGDFTTANTVYVYFNTFDSSDPSASVTLTGLALGDILIYKNGSVTERSSTAGFTLLDTDGIDFDGKTGIHGFSIDLSNNTDSGFYAAGGEYTVVVASVTVDAATVNFVAAQFSIERTGGALALLKGTNSLANIEDKIDTLTTNVATVDTVVDGIQTDLSNGTDGLGAIKADTAAILVDTAVIGAAGAGLTAIPWNASWDAEVQSEVTDALAVYDPPTKAELDSGLAALNDLDTAGVATAVWNAATATYGSAGSYGLLVETNLDAAVSGATAPTAAAVADAVWDEALSGHLSAGSTGEALNAAGAAGDPWTTTLPGAYTGSQAGKMLSDIITDTAEIGAAGAGLTAVPWNASWDAEVQSEVTDALTAASIPTATENADALLNRDMSAVSDTTARSPLNALRLLRNKWTSSGGTLTVTKEDDTTSAWTATLTGDAAADPVVGSDPA